MKDEKKKNNHGEETNNREQKKLRLRVWEAKNHRGSNHENDITTISSSIWKKYINKRILSMY